MIKLRQLIVQSLQGLVKRYHGRIQPNKIKQLYNGDPSKNKNYASAMCQMYLNQKHTNTKYLITLFNWYNQILLNKQKYNIQVPNQIQLLKDYNKLLQFVDSAKQTIQDKKTGATVYQIFRNRQVNQGGIKIVFRNNN